LWLEAHRAAVERQDHAQAWQHAQAALAADPSSFAVYRTVAEYLLAQQRPAEAEPYFKWCLDRKPDDRQLRAALETATKGRINAQTQASAANAKRPPEARQ
jgi:predicted Zn-dependent protease